MSFLFVLHLVCRSDHKDIMDEVSENQQSGYTQCKSELKFYVFMSLSMSLHVFKCYLHKWHCEF